MDKILKEFFAFDRWVKGIEKGVLKDIRQDVLKQLTTEGTRKDMAMAMMQGRYEIAPPHTAQIPKDNGDFRTVYINEPIDRVVLSIANDMLFELCGDMVHPACTSYQSGIGCGKVVREVSRRIASAKSGEIIGWKSDLSKYFDSVPLRYIDAAFDAVETRHGRSVLIDVLRKYYHCNWYFDTDNQLQQKFQSLKQGCAVAAWLADVLLYHIDEKLSALDGYYVRYSDDMLFVGPDHEQAMAILRGELEKMEMKLNPKKVEMLGPDHWFKFLGYSIKGESISISSTRIKTFQKEIERRTIKKQTATLSSALQSVNHYLYRGDGEHSWATQILPVCNVKSDIDKLNMFVMDCLRAVHTNRRKVGGLGYDKCGKVGCVVRGTGRNVNANRLKLPKIEGYLTLGCMQNALKIRRAVYATLVASL